MPIRRLLRAATRQADPVTGTELSPWPTSDPARQLAIERLKAAIQGRATESDDEAAALGAAAAARVEREAPAAPQSIKDECVIRVAGYWSQADFGTIQDETIGPLSRTYTMNHAGAFRLCGAYGLLSPWKKRRAGTIG